MQGDEIRAGRDIGIEPEGGLPDAGGGGVTIAPLPQQSCDVTGSSRRRPGC